MRRRSVCHAAFVVALMTGLVTSPRSGWSQDQVPVPASSPATSDTTAQPAPSEPADPAIEGPATPLDEIPIPEERPVPPADEAPAAGAPAPSAGPATTEGEKQSTAAPEPKPSDAAEPDVAADAPPESDGADTIPPITPQPAYVPPAKARTTPEPGAPQAPAMEVTPAQSVEAAAAVEDAVLCEAELKKRGATFTVGTTIADGDCGVLRPVTLTALSSGVSLSPDTQFLCRTALALDIWMADGVMPAAKSTLGGATIRSLTQASTYVCRARASEAKISEHSRGSAIDVGGFGLSDGRTLTIGQQAPGSTEDRFEAAIRRAACGPFKTVLGPGTDADHGTHLHLDLAARSNGSTYCR